MAALTTQRSLFSVTFSVWRALFLREALFRVAQDRIAWVWLIVEPISHVALLMWVFTSFRHVVIAGADAGVFAMLSVTGFFFARNVMTRGMDAINQNTTLFTYRQVKPVDTVLVRAVLEGFIQMLVMLVILAGAGLLGFPVVPADPLGAVVALVVLWLLGLGFALIISVAGTLVPEIAHVTRLLINPIYFLSAVMYPSIILPHAMRDVFLLNPLVHAIESLRIAFMPAYQVPQGIDLAYPACFAVVLILLGLALHIRYQYDLIEQ
ncbi:MAG: ABC transporter permease [Candidatus Parcubacteria bacterium]|nr:ABC transporter permease [Burkholderiales bacterium]